MKAVKEKAYAKINLSLNVVGRRADGFHDVETVMHTVSLADEITVEVFPSRMSDVTLRFDGECRLPTDDRNIALKAARLYLDRAGISDSVNITLVKNIPVAAGLAGGSTDAAAVLRALNKLYDKRLSTKALLSLAAELGSDVPFCLLGGTALCLGRGERIERLPDVRGLDLVIAVADGEHISTPEAYSELDRLYSDFDGSVRGNGDLLTQRLLCSVKGGEIDPSSLYNIFEEAILPRCEGASAIKARMLELGALGALMSGSGPSVYGIFDTEDSARRATEVLKNNGVRAYLAKSV